MHQSFAWPGAARHLLVPVTLTFVALSASSAQGDRVISGTVKTTATANFTSWGIQTTNNNTVPDNVPGWTRNRVGPRLWSFTGGTTAPGGTFSVNLPGAGAPGGQVTYGDYVSNGRTVWVGTCLDPIGFRVVSGGAAGNTYLGYSIPANQFGYFYQMYNPTNYGGISKTASIGVGTASGATNFQVLASAFPFLPAAGFDLQDLALPDINRLDNNYNIQQYMEAADAVSAGTLAGLVPVSWSFNAGSGVASLTFQPGSSGAGLNAAESSPVVAYTSPFGPGLTDSPNITTSFVNTFNCPSDYILVPMPEPVSALMMAGAGLGLARRARR